MNKLLEHVKEYQELLGPVKYDDLNDLTGRLSSLVLALNAESFEFLNELPWKKHVPLANQKFSPVYAFKELVDCFIYLFDMWVILKESTEIDLNLEQHLLHKIETNKLRLKQGEHKPI